MGCPSIAVSLNSFTPPFHFTIASSFIANNIDLFKGLWKEDHFINVNVPNTDGEPEIAITHPSRRIYEDKAVGFSSPGGHQYFFLAGSWIGARGEDGSDWEAVMHGRISVSPIYLHPVNHAVEDRYRDVDFSGKRSGGQGGGKT